MSRRLVLATVALSAFMAAMPGTLHGFAMVVVLVIAVLDVLLVRSTDGLAFVRSRSLDERQRALRDRAYRLGFRLLGLAVVLLVVLAVVTTVLATSLANNGVGSGPGFAQLDAGLSGRLLVAILEFLVIMPTLVIAWVQLGPTDEDTANMSAEPTRQMRTGAVWLGLPLLMAAWIVVALAAPVQTAGASTGFTEGFTLSGASCRHFVGGRIVGAEFGATVGLRAEVCWNHKDAFVVGDPKYPLPQSALADLGPPGVPPPPNFVDLTDASVTECGGDSLDDFAAIASLHCTATIDAAGTLHYAVHARVTPLPFSIGTRDVTVSLVVDRNGRVLAQP